MSSAAAEVEDRLCRADTGYFPAVEKTSGRIFAFRRWELHEGFYFTGPLYVLPSLRRSGIARKPIRHVERWPLPKGQNIPCISCAPHDQAMINLARSEGYETLNTVELRKNLKEDAAEPCGEVQALGFKWRAL